MYWRAVRRILAVGNHKAHAIALVLERIAKVSPVVFLALVFAGRHSRRGGGVKSAKAVPAATNKLAAASKEETTICFFIFDFFPKK